MTPDEGLAFAYLTEHPEDAARLLERASPADAAAILGSLPADVGADVYRALGPAAAAACAALMPDEQFANLIEALPLDFASAVLRGVDQKRRDPLIDRLSDERREQLRRMLAYPENTAGAVADPLVLALPEDITVADAQRQLRGTQQNLFYYLYVVTRERRLVGTLALPELMAAPLKESLATVMRRNLVRLDAHTDVATVTAHPAWRDYDALPVVDSTGRLIGGIRHKTIRRMSQDPARPMMETIVGLSELYWTGLSGILASLTPARANRAEDIDVA